MILKHNIKPERAAEIAAVMRESKQAFGSLAYGDVGDNCFCALGCIAEAYRRAHEKEGSAWWTKEPCGAIVFRSFPPSDCIHIHQSSSVLSTSPHVLEWAVKDYGVNDVDPPIIYLGQRRITFSTLNDERKFPLAWFADVLEGKEVEV